MFAYDFMRIAFLTGGLLAIIIPIVGFSSVLQRRSMIGDAMSHISLAGIVAGVLLNINPLLGAILLAIVAALSLDFIQKKLGRYQEIAIAILMSTGIGLSGVLLGFIDNPGNFNTFLYGSIVSIDMNDNWIAIVLSLVVIGVACFMYRNFFYLAFDEESADIAGVNVQRTQRILTLLTAVTIAIASRIVGALVVSSLMVLPIASAMQLAKSYKGTLIMSILMSLLSMWLGLTFAYYADLRPGGTIVLTSVAVLCLTFMIKSGNIKHSN